MNAIFANEPDRIELAHLPTPLQPGRFCFSDSAGQPIKRQVWFKRDDYSGMELSGNKVRKLEYLLAEAHQQAATTLVTCGGEQSNHARATAAAAARLGLRCHLVLRCADPGQPPTATGNILINQLMGATMHWIAQADWRHRDQIMADLAARLADQGQRGYVIPVGGSNALGSWGYVRAMAELATDLDRQHLIVPNRPTTIVYACGSGGTAAGLIIGAKLLGLADRGVRIVGVNVSDNRAYFVAEILRIAADFEQRFHCGVTVTEHDIHIADGHVGAGYAKSLPAEIATIRALAASDGVILDPVYSGKAFHGLGIELQRDPQWPEMANGGPEHGANERRLGAGPIVFIHTGGLFGTFGASSIVHFQ
jgi:D-cysteine desulfhydrase